VPPRAPPSTLRALPRLPRSSPQRNRPRVPGIITGVAIFPADTRGPRHEIRRRRPISGQDDLASEPRVSSRIIPPSLMSVEPCSTAGVGRQRPERAWPPQTEANLALGHAWPAWPAEVAWAPLSALEGQNAFGAKSLCRFFFN
jgi:hypothetical protein